MCNIIRAITTKIEKIIFIRLMKFEKCTDKFQGNLLKTNSFDYLIQISKVSVTFFDVNGN